MRTTITPRVERGDAVVQHVLEEGETWSMFGADQPNPQWTHDSGWAANCKLCALYKRPG